MKKSLASIVALGFSMASMAAFAQTAAPTMPTTPIVPGGPSTGAPPAGAHDHHPEIRKAMTHLQQADKNLKEGATDFGGHKVQAEQMIEQAEQQLQMALQDAGH